MPTRLTFIIIIFEIAASRGALSEPILRVGAHVDSLYLRDIFRTAESVCERACVRANLVEIVAVLRCYFAD